MGTNKSRFSPRCLTPAQQSYFLLQAFPGFSVATARNRLCCTGVLRPSPTSDIYTVQLDYDPPTRPRVRVLRPELRLAKGKTKVPHVFAEGDLCLHLKGEWRPDQRISEFIIPWISLWLYFYEVWLETGDWLGEGHEPSAEAR